MVVNCLLPTPGMNAAAMEWLSKRRRIPLRGGEAEGAGAKVAEILRQFKVDLVVLHACGGRDSCDVIDVARSVGIPIAIVHHFANDRLGAISARQQVCRVAAVGGASLVGVPRYLRHTFWNLSDAVDTDFYNRSNARPIDTAPTEPFIFAPGRYTPEKGQVDVIEVVYRLTLRGLRPKVVFAGRADAPAFEAHLRALVEQRGLGDLVTFLGALSLEQYRDWYYGAAVMLMPTLHGEGMPRTLIESQAMQVPPVVYDIGGTSEGVRHGETGFLVKRGDVEGMAAAAERLLGDQRLQQSMGRAGRRFVESAFSLPALAERHEQFYAHVLGRRPR
jgi:glycosyltransferase involved in cell wall biosynthesis